MVPSGPAGCDLDEGYAVVKFRDDAQIAFAEVLKEGTSIFFARRADRPATMREILITTASLPEVKEAARGTPLRNIVDARVAFSIL
jgi:hypothetical protein